MAYLVQGFLPYLYHYILRAFLKTCQSTKNKTPVGVPEQVKIGAVFHCEEDYWNYNAVNWSLYSLFTSNINK